MCVPINYKGVENNYDYKIVISEFPQCGYTLDSYRAWLAGGGDIKQKVQVVKGVSNGVFGLFSLVNNVANAAQNIWNKAYDTVANDKKANKGLTQSQIDANASAYANQQTTVGGALNQGGAVGGVGGLLNGVVQTYTDYKTTEFDSHAQPNVPVGMTAGNVMVGARVLNFRCYDVDINRVDAQIIDEFFDKYGYQTNRLKVPNISGRKAWNYVKTRDCELLGNIPAMTKASIIDIFNSGITFWKNGDLISDYTQDNSLTP
jgi:hypothetical protein